MVMHSADTSGETVFKAFLHNRISMFGVPSTVTVDRSAQRQYKFSTEFSALLEITHSHERVSPFV